MARSVLSSVLPGIVGLLAILPASAPCRAQARELVVGPGGIATLTEAVARAGAGDRIRVLPGTYAEPTIVLDRPLELMGEGRPVLDGQGVNQILTITSDSVSVRGFVLRNVATTYVEDRAAVKVERARFCTIEDNVLEDTFFGIYLANAGDCRIANNRIEGGRARETASGNGIHMWYSRNVTVTGNEIRGHRDGIYFEFVQDCEVAENLSEDNFRYGLHFMFSDGCRYAGNAFRRNGAGVAVMYTRDVEMSGNTFEANWGSASFGLLLKDITDSRITGNRFIRNTTGLYAEGSNRLEVEGNDFERNGWAVRIMANAQNNRFTRNNFVANTFDVATNSRRSESDFDGNFWDAYSGYDLNRDGIGDVPFRPVRLFSFLVERNEPNLVLLRSFFVQVLDAAEAVIPVLTPETLVDARPAMRRIP